MINFCLVVSLIYFAGIPVSFVLLILTRVGNLPLVESFVGALLWPYFICKGLIDKINHSP